MADQITRKELYEMMEKKTKDERDLRHAQSEKFSAGLIDIGDRMEKGFEKVMEVMSSNYATKEEVKNLREKVNGHSSWFKVVSTMIVGSFIGGILKLLGLY